MIEALKSLFGSFANGGEQPIGVDLGVAVLMLEAAHMDGAAAPAELAVAKAILERQFVLDKAGVEALLTRADTERQRSTELVRFTRAIKDHMPFEERDRMMEWLWEIVYADGIAHDMEMSLMRRIAGLIYVSDQANGAARKRVRIRLGLND